MTLRINGFSGMDIDSMVKQLMTAKRAPLDKLNQQKTYLSWQRDSYREMNSKVFAFKSKLSDTFGKTINMTSQTAVVSDNTDAIKAEATSTATGTAMQVVVDQVATKTTISAKGPLTTKDGTKEGIAKLSTSISSLIDYPASSDTDKAETYKLTINEKEIEFSSKDTLSSVISKINNSSANVTAVFDEVSGKFSIASKDFGKNGKVDISETSSTGNGSKLLSLLHIDTSDTSTITQGDGAKITVTSDGVSNEFTSDNSNNITVNGINITAIKVTATGDKPSTITTTIDTTKAVDTIKSFINTYNDLLNTMNSKVDEEKYRDFPPLTDEQRSAMKETEITAWEAKAKSGLLKNDDILKDTITAMRSVINNSMGQLSAMGITTGQYYEGGKLYLDEDKLKQALQSNPQQLSDLFQGSDGIVNKLSTTMTSTLQKFSDRAGTNRFSGDLSAAFKDESVMGKQMKEYTSRISDLIKRLDDQETRYYKQFSAMETAMNQLQSQSSSLFGTTQ
ncbi:flagellar filament capping protein FliD [Paenibacillus favisporus]|uniref:flagellar filament capping protein FliD n=1 Tax=Paenibacillus favisporus TaxID=221028 RepID=UPI002DB7B495|nr:flagellar filament capping protein FliD [Paenibacillus favisporus]MEC0174667.1 flagellar filament capping protein FliD [Paenibacillus favisporus]